MYLVDVLRPRTIVELGTHSGDSYCAFCQAVAELRLPATCHAVDTWTGDPQAGEYGPEVLADLRAHHDPLYGGFSELHQTTFDDALGRFQDGSIDLLHIDGCHRYDEVRHDFDGWRPKLSPRGVVLLHDTARHLDDFGVWRLVEELRLEYPLLEFVHASGLALVLVGDEPPEPARELAALADGELHAFRSLFAALGAGVRRAGEAQRAATERERLRKSNERLEAALAQLEQRFAVVEARTNALANSRILRLARRLR